MILSKIRQYLTERGQATLSDLALRFDSNPDAMRGMLDQWVRRGKVRKLQANASCGSGCTQCDPATAEVYQWVGDDSGEPPAPVDTPASCTVKWTGCAYPKPPEASRG